MNDTVSRRNFLKGKFSVFVIKSQLLLAVYWFPIVTLTNYWKLSGSRQHKFIILQLCRSEVHSECWWAQIKVLAGLCSFPEDQKGRMQVFLPFPASGGCLCLARAWSSSISKASNDWSSVSHITLLRHSSAFPFHLPEPLWLHWAHLDNLPFLRPTS